MSEDTFFHAMCTYRLKSNRSNPRESQHVSLSFDLSSSEAHTMQAWLSIFDFSLRSSVVKPEVWQLCFFQVLEREDDQDKEPKLPKLHSPS
jgi:hypothetical protein